MPPQELGPVATRKLFENADVNVWEMDLQPGEVCGLHHHALDYVLFILSGAEVGVESPGRKPTSFPVKARSTYFVPAGGIESAHNVGATRFFEALIEIKRPARKGAEKLGFVGCEALAGREPEPGMVTILDNDRVRVREITLAPGGELPMRRWGHDAVAYIAEGGEVKIAERAGAGEAAESARRETLPAGAVRWYPRGAPRSLQNLGAGRFREVIVELK
jgi:quercetin dioxygenase-like cupin family protein/mannose-6-phosphate isomerase-like protein (cupin superfamily)